MRPDERRARDGDGVDPALVPRLFARFTTAVRRTYPGRRRYGLGLALVAEVVTARHGWIELVQAGDGPTFRLALPATGGPRARHRHGFEEGQRERDDRARQRPGWR